MRGKPITAQQAMQVLRLYYRNKIGDCAEVGRLTDLSKNGVSRVVRFYGVHAHLRHVPEVKRWIAAARAAGVKIPDPYPDSQYMQRARVNAYDAATSMKQARRDAIQRHKAQQADDAAQHTRAGQNGPQRGVQTHTGQAVGGGASGVPQLAMDFGGPQPTVVQLPDDWVQAAARVPYGASHVLPWEEHSLLVRPLVRPLVQHDTAPLPGLPDGWPDDWPATAVPCMMCGTLPTEMPLAWLLVDGTWRHRCTALHAVAERTLRAVVGRDIGDIIAAVALLLEQWELWQYGGNVSLNEVQAAVVLLQEAYDAYNQDV